MGLVEMSILFTSFIAVTYGFGVYLFATVLPEMKAELRFSYTESGGMIALAQCGFLLAALSSAVLTHRLGAVRLMLLSMVVCVLCLVLMAFAQTMVQVSVLLLFAAAAAAAVWVPMAAVAQETIEARHQGKAIGLMSSGTAYGMFVNGLAVPVLLPLYGWRSVWVFVALLGALSLCWGWWRLSARKTIPPTSTPPTISTQEPRLTPERAVITQSKGSSRSGLWQQLRQPAALLILGMMLVSGIACMPVQNYLMAFLREDLAYPVAQAGRAVAIIGLVGMVGGFLMGALADKITLACALTLTYLLLALASGLFLYHGDVWVVYVGAAIFGLAFNAIFGLLPAHINLHFSPHAATAIFGVGTVALGVGSVLGNFFGGYIHDVSGSFAPIYLASAAAALLLASACTLLQK